jgi:hypothetical protein
MVVARCTSLEGQFGGKLKHLGVKRKCKVGNHLTGTQPANVWERFNWASQNSLPHRMLPQHLR